MNLPPERTWAAEQSTATKRQLMLAAMRLMAKEGIEGVSLRAVNVKAGARNTSAAHYHFGNKLGLIEAVVDMIASEVASVRCARVEELRERAKSGGEVTVRDVLEATFLPFFGLLFHHEYGVRSIRFLSRLIADTDPETRVVLNRFTTPLAEEMLELLTPTLAHIPERTLKIRILYSLINLISGTADGNALPYSPLGDLQYANAAESGRDFFDYIEAGLSAPVTPLSPEFEALCMEYIQLFTSERRDTEM